MKKYTLYFHDIVESLPMDLDENEQPIGECFDFNDFERYINPNVMFKLIPDEELTDTPTNHLNDHGEYMFEVWLDFEAKDDKDAMQRAESILGENGFEWVSVYYVLEQYLQQRTVGSVGIRND